MLSQQIKKLNIKKRKVSSVVWRQIDYRGTHFREHSFSYTIESQQGRSIRQGCMSVFEELTVHGGMRASIPWTQRGVKIRR